ncbi:AimR family lysis-lysogeny pheromone receptor [Bacillus cereus]|nr:AimR family lysis-lysogeny pheromone receptor [Bacillus cereus]
MESLMRETNKRIEFKGMSKRKLAKQIGVSVTTICNGLSCITDEMKFDVFKNLVWYVYENTEERTKKIREFMKLCESNLNIRKSLSYCQVTGEYNIMQFIIQEHKENSEVRKYLNAYGLYNKRNLNKCRGKKLLDEIYLSDISVDPECQVLINTLYMAGMYDEQNYNAMSPYTDIVESNLLKIKNKFIKECLEWQYKERVAYIELLGNEIEKCRKTCNEIIHSESDFSVIKATALCCLGESFVFENKFEAERYIKLAISCLDDANSLKQSQKRASFMTTLAFLYIEFGFNLDQIDFKYISEGELAYYECKYGDKQKGLAIFEKLEVTKGLTAFQMYYLSQVNNDIMMLKKSLESFEKMGNLFYIQLAKKALVGEGVL